MKPWWFSLDNRWAEDEKFMSLTHSEKLLWIAILCLASQHNKSVVLINFKYLDVYFGLSEKFIRSTICKLPITIWTESDHDLDRIWTAQDKTIQDKTIQNTSSELKQVSVLTDFNKVSDIFIERSVSERTQTLWLKAYPDANWITEKVLQLVIWENENPSRKKINFSRFVSNALARDWDRRKIGGASHGGALGEVIWKKEKDTVTT